jgi:hypothetical protein
LVVLSASFQPRGLLTVLLTRGSGTSNAFTWTIEPVYVRDFLQENHIHIPNTQTPDQSVAMVREHAAKAANGIKLFSGSCEGQGKVAVLPLAIARAAVEEAHRHSLPVFSHPQNVDGVNVRPSGSRS